MKQDECEIMKEARRADGRRGFLRAAFIRLPLVAGQGLIFLIRLYRLTLSPAKTFLGGPLAQCRFTPSCSEYAVESLRTHGAVNGSWHAVKRVCRCHPWGGCGHDPVPGKSEIRNRKSEIGMAPAHS